MLKFKIVTVDGKLTGDAVLDAIETDTIGEASELLIKRAQELGNVTLASTDYRVIPIPGILDTKELTKTVSVLEDPNRQLSDEKLRDKIIEETCIWPDKDKDDPNEPEEESSNRSEKKKRHEARMALLRMITDQPFRAVDSFKDLAEAYNMLLDK